MDRPSPEHLKTLIKDAAMTTGFHAIGVSAPEIAPKSRARHREWLTRGFNADMEYLHRSATFPQSFPDVSSVVICAVSYHTPPPFSREAKVTGDHGWISRYAWGRNYHKVVVGMLRRMMRAVTGRLGVPIPHRLFVDSLPLPEKTLAAQAGLGFQGRNTLLINPQLGSFIFLGGVLLELTLPPDTPDIRRCPPGCDRCIKACPQGALSPPGVLDARRCTSYLTIEHNGPIPEDRAPGIGENVFGCDICQEVCPFNAHPPYTTCADFNPSPGLLLPRLDHLGALSSEAFDDLRQGTVLGRRKYPDFLDNVRVVKENRRQELLRSGREDHSEKL